MIVYICKMHDTSEDDYFSAYKNKDKIIDDIQKDIADTVVFFLKNNCVNLKLMQDMGNLVWRLEENGGEYFREWEIITCDLNEEPIRILI